MIELRRLSQSIIFPSDHPDVNIAGESKGTKKFLADCGSWTYYKEQRKVKKPPYLKLKYESIKNSGLTRDRIY